MNRAVRGRVLALTAFAATLAAPVPIALLPAPALAFTPGDHIRIVGPDLTVSRWPDVDGTRPGFIEAGREPSAPVRALPLLPTELARRAPEERRAALELAEILRAASERRDEPHAAFPAEFAIAPSTDPEGGGRLRPEQILFAVPPSIRTHAPPPGPEPAGGPVPVPVSAPARPGDPPWPRSHPRRPDGLLPEGATLAQTAPANRTAPDATIAAHPDVAVAAPPGASAEAGRAPRSAPVPRPSPRAVATLAAPPEVADAVPPPAFDLAAPPPGPIPWESTAAAGSARAAAATPFITLWPSSAADAEDQDGADRDGAEEASAGADGGPPRPLPPGPQPYRLVRLLTALQDDIARGAGAALAAQGVLQRRLEERFAAALPEEWAEPRNARALVIYALSGGNPGVVRRVVDGATLAPPFDALAAGALAYLEGRAGDARRHFAAAEGAPLDASIAGSVQLARAALAVDTDPAAALGLLERARAAAPASLVEEAALRRALLVAAEMDDVATFERLVARYLGKFRRSLYAGNFRQRLASAVTRMSFVREPAAFVRLEAMVAPMSDAGRQELYLLLARAAIESGNRLAAGIAADRALATALTGTLDARRAALYRAAAEVVDPEKFEAAVATLRALETAELPEDERAILYAALRLSRTVTELPPPTPGAFGSGRAPEHAGEDPADASGAEGAFGGRFDVAAVEQRVAQAIARVDALLEDTP